MALINAPARRRALLKNKIAARESDRALLLARLRELSGLGADVSDDEVAKRAVAAVERRIEGKRAAHDAWAAAEAAEQRAHLERRFGAFARLRDGALAVVRRPDAMPPGATRVSPTEARGAIQTARLRVVGHHGCSSPDLHPDAFLRLAGPLLSEAA